MPNEKEIDAEYVESMIVREDSTTFELKSGSCMIVELTLKNGYIVKGAAAYFHNCDAQEEQEAAFMESKTFSRNAAISKIWSLEGYLKQQRLNPPDKESRLFI